MPIGPTYEPNNQSPSHQSLLYRFSLGLATLIGAAFTGAGAAAVAVINAIRQSVFENNPNAPLTPDQCAVAVVKNTDPGGDFAGEARLSGTSPERFDVMVGLTGNPPGPETLLAMLNRGLIQGSDVERGVRQGYLKDEWFQPYLGLRYALLSPAELIQADVQGQIDKAVSQQLWAANGMDPELYDVAYNTAGNPPGPGETLTMLQRGILTEAEAVQALRESRLKDKYIPQFLQLVRRRIPMRTLNTLVAHGAITEAVALQDLLDLGFNQSDADALIKSATATGSKAAKAETVGQITALYSTHVITQAQAVAHLETLGYPAEVAGELLQLGDARAVLTLQNQAVTALRSRYVAHRIDEPTARADLLAAGLDEAKIAALLVLWNIEQTANPRELTEAQLRAAANAGVITVTEYTSRLVGMGYTGADAQILASTHFPTPTGG